MTEKQKPDFVVSDRRRFTESGEATSSSDQPEVQPETSASPSPQPKSSDAHVASQKFTTDQVRAQAEPPPPTEAEQQQQSQDYKAGSQRLDDLLREGTGERAEHLTMTFERLVASLYMTAMLQLGLMAPEGEQPRVDIVGARQTIDTLGILNEKTKGNLTPGEQNLLQQSLFELRMAFLELANAITRAPAPGAAGKPK
jgi:hypothetical protein